MINIRCDWKQIQDHGISFNEYLIIVVMAKGSNHKVDLFYWPVSGNPVVE